MVPFSPFLTCAPIFSAWRNVSQFCELKPRSVQAIHKIQSHNLFISAGLIVGFDADDLDIFDEQFNFLQAAGIPMAMLSWAGRAVAVGVPRSPRTRRSGRSGRRSRGGA